MKTIENASPQRAAFGAWPKSHTAQQAVKSILETEALCDQIGMSTDDWKMLLFESGCRYVEAKYKPEFWQYVLQDPQTHFWDKWLQDWLKDDADQLHTGIASAKEYRGLKEMYTNEMIMWR